MLRIKRLMVVAIALGALGGCAVVRYPMLPAWSSEEGQALSCSQLDAEMTKALQTQVQIQDIATGQYKASPPRLYSTARSDADRALKARIAAIEDLRQAKNCSAER